VARTQGEARHTHLTLGSRRRLAPNERLPAVNVRTNHVHVVVTAERHPSDIMDQLKGWCARKLSDDAGLTTPAAKRAGRRHWFTDAGDKEKIEDEEHFANAIRYVLERQ
jgi:REP element-mobilizing transposase RayT